MKPLVSIGVSCCNFSGFTSRCLNSIFAYSDLPFDLKIVNNGSTDDTKSILDSLKLEELQKANPNFCGLEIVHFPENRFLSAATNEMFRDRQGDFLMFVPNDTIMTQDYLSRLVKGMEKYNLDLGSPRWYESKMLPGYQNPDISDPLEWATQFAEEFVQTHGAVFGNMKRDDLEPGWAVGICYIMKNWVWKKIEAIGGWDSRLVLSCQDNDFCWKNLIMGHRLGIMNDCYIFHVGAHARSNDVLNPTWRETGDADWQKFIELWGTHPDDFAYLEKLKKEGVIRKKTPEDGPDSGVPPEIKERRITK